MSSAALEHVIELAVRLEQDISVRAGSLSRADIVKAVDLALTRVFARSNAGNVAARLPHDILSLVFAYYRHDWERLVAISAVCSQWRTCAVGDRRLWQTVTIKANSEHSERSRAAARAGDYEHVELSDCICRKDTVGYYNSTNYRLCSWLVDRSEPLPLTFAIRTDAHYQSHVASHILDIMQTHASRIRSLSFEILYGCDLWLRILSLLPDDMPLLADLEVSLHMEDPNRIHDIGILRQHSGLWTPYAALQSLVFSGLHDVEYPADKSYSITSFTISDVTISRSDLARYFDLFPNLVDLRLYDCHHDISSSEPLPNQLQELHFCVRGDDFWDDFQPEDLGTALSRVDPEHVPLVTFTSSCVDAMRFAALFSTMAPPTEITIDLARHTDVAGRLPGYLVGVVEAVAMNDEAQGRRYIVPHWGPKSPSAWAGVFHQCELHAVARMTVTHYVWGLIGRLNARLPSLQFLEVTFISQTEWAAEYVFLGKSDVDAGDRCDHSLVKRMQPPCALPSLRLIRLAPCAAAFRPCSVPVTTVLDIIGSLSSGRSILPDLEVKGLALVEDEGATVTSIRNVVAQLSYV